MAIGMQAQKERDVARRAAIRRSGHNFITLVLKDTRKRRIAGVEIVNAWPGEDENGAPIFRTEVVGGELVFEPDPEFGMDMICHMLDSEHNRAFLASHHAMQWWEIEIRNDRDRAVAMEIERKAKGIKTEIVPPNDEAIISFTADQIRARKEELRKQLADLEEMETEKVVETVSMEDVAGELGAEQPSDEEAILRKRLKMAERKYSNSQTQKTKEKWAIEVQNCKDQLAAIEEPDLVIEE